MTPKENIIIRRSTGDTDPVYMILNVSNNNVIESVSNTANVDFIFSDITIRGEPIESRVGAFFFPFSNVEIDMSSSDFSVVVDEDTVTYTIAKGTINFI